MQAVGSLALETGCVREAQIEAVIDAVILSAFREFPDAAAHLRQVGAWCARIAARLSYGPDPEFARRVGVLSEIDPGLLAALPELRVFAGYVAGYQSMAVAGESDPQCLALIVLVADEFTRRVTAFEAGLGDSPAAAARAMLGGAVGATVPIVEALVQALGMRKGTCAVSGGGG